MTNMSPATQFALIATLVGTCGVAWRGDLVVASRLPDARPAATARFFAERRKAQERVPPEPVQQAITAMTGLLEGDRTDLSFIACGFEGVDPFAAKVYVVTRNLAPGETSTYGEIAEEIGEKQRAREVGQALGHNPLPIIVPCHRVLGAGGKLTGFSAPGGVQLKLKMLEIEGAQIGGAPGLFGDLPLSLKA
ncbi:methylated-DNA--[protein]-cysteine S-methyltransferase [Tateyamaria sp. SN3-11]|uniref:methylated-DNA--[protein]-cysteine S-methyltransferase n=1 Tax=Tateyamaria sp. SN3-11 TaxID=3092147 RepID=UPI0039E82FC5